MSFLAPAAIALGLLAIPIILLYMLRLRRREQLISSTLLWRELVHDRSANMPWQRLRRNLLLILQLIILTALVIALARPFFAASGQVEGHLIVLLDASASMTATDGDNGQIRFDEATGQVNRLIDEVGAGDRMTLIRVGRTPAVLAAMTNDRQALRQALGSASPDYSAADWTAAFAIAAGAMQSQVDARVVILSDGNLPDNLPSLPGEVEFMPIGRSGNNLAITAQGARPADGNLNYLAGVTNFGDEAASALLSLYVDGVLFDSRRIEMAPGDSVDETWLVPGEAGVIEARLTADGSAGDYLAVDNQAWTVTGDQQERRVLLLSEGNLFLERLFALLPGYTLARMANDEVMATELGGEAPFDLYIFDNVPLPDPLPAGGILIFNPQPMDDSAAIRVSSSFTNTQVIRLADSPLLEDVNWGSVNVSEARVVEAGGLETIIEAQGGPLLLAGEIDNRRVGLFTFDLRHSDLPLQIAFPVIMANIIGWLDPGGAVSGNSAYETGSAVVLVPNPRAEAITVEMPNGELREHAGLVADEPLIFSTTGEPGVYTVNHIDEAGEVIATDKFAVNFSDPEESRIQPQPSIRIGQTEVTGSESGATGRYEIWPWLLIAGLMFLFIEWWVAYSRRQKQPSLKY